MAKLILEYSTEAQFRSALASIPPNLVEAGTSVELLQTKAEILWSAPVTITGIITGPDNGIRLGCALNASYIDNADIQTLPFAYSSTSGAAWKSTQPYKKYLLQIDVPHVTVDGMQFFQASGETEKVLLTSKNANYFKMLRSIVDNAGSRNYCYPMELNGGFAEFYSSLIVHRSSVEDAIYLNNNSTLFENVNIVRPSNFTNGGNVFRIVQDKVTARNCIFTGFGATVSKGTSIGSNNVSSGLIGFGTNNLENQLAADIFINPLNDFRTKKSALLEDKGATPSSANTRAVNGVRQQGMSADIGAWEQPSTLVAPSATVNNVVISGTNNNNVVISGVTTGAPTKGTISIFPTDVDYNGAVGQGPIDVTLTTNGFSAAFQNLRVGAYGISIKVSNDAYSESGINAFGTFEIVGAGALTVVQEPISGQMYTLRGTTSGNPTSASLYLPPDATNPEGAVGQTIPVNLTPGAFEASQSLPAGNYDAGLLTFTNAQGTSFPQPGTFPVSIIGIDGNPELPGDDDQAVPTITSVTVSPSTANGSTQFTAVVVGENFPDQSVLWSATGGTVNAQGMFTAPAPTSSERVIVVTATSVLDPNKSGSASVTIAASNEPVDPTDPTEPVEPTTPTVTSVEVSPAEASASTVFTASVQGINNPPSDVTWVSEPAGFVSATGVFTAPAPSGVVQRIIVTAYSNFDPSKSDSSVVTIAALTGSSVTNVVISPTASTVAGGEKLLFNASIIGSGGPSQEVTWSSVGGSVDFDGLFTAPAAAIFSQSVTVTARSVQNPAKFATATVTIPAVSYEGSNPSYAPLRHFDSNVTNKFGVAVEGAEVHVLISQTGAKADLYADKGKTRKIWNPILTDDEGYFEFYVEAYQCDYTVKGSGLETFTRKDIFDIINNVDLGPIYLALDGLNKRLLIVESGVGNPPVLVVKFPWEN